MIPKNYTSHMNTYWCCIYIIFHFIIKIQSEQWYVLKHPKYSISRKLILPLFPSLLLTLTLFCIKPRRIVFKCPFNLSKRSIKIAQIYAARKNRTSNQVFRENLKSQPPPVQSSLNYGQPFCFPHLPPVAVVSV